MLVITSSAEPASTPSLPSSVASGAGNQCAVICKPSSLLFPAGSSRLERFEIDPTLWMRSAPYFGREGPVTSFMRKRTNTNRKTIPHLEFRNRKASSINSRIGNALLVNFGSLRSALTPTRHSGKYTTNPELDVSVIFRNSRKCETIHPEGLPGARFDRRNHVPKGIRWFGIPWEVQFARWPKWFADRRSRSRPWARPR